MQIDYCDQPYILLPSEISSRFSISRYIIFDMHLDISYVYMHNKIYVRRKTKMSNNLALMEYALVGDVAVDYFSV
jgi:hypothetical protein